MKPYIVAILNCSMSFLLTCGVALGLVYLNLPKVEAVPIQEQSFNPFYVNPDTLAMRRLHISIYEQLDLLSKAHHQQLVTLQELGQEVKIIKKLSAE